MAITGMKKKKSFFMDVWFGFTIRWTRKDTSGFRQMQEGLRRQKPRHTSQVFHQILKVIDNQSDSCFWVGGIADEGGRKTKRSVKKGRKTGVFNTGGITWWHKVMA